MPTYSGESEGRTFFDPLVGTEEQSTEGSDIIVIHPGSLFLRIGRASDVIPTTLSHCIARLHKTPGVQTRYEDPWMIRPEANHDEHIAQQMEGLEMASDALSGRPTAAGMLRRTTRTDQLAAFNKTSKPEVSDSVSNLNWTKASRNRQFLIGQEALMINPNESYDLHWPIRHGELNLHDGVGGSMSAVMQDLKDIWTTALYKHLDISADEIKGYRVVLLVGDVYRRQHVRELTELLLNAMNFSSLFVVQESVCATFGAGIPSACVVDIGDQKVSLSCIEDGLSHPPSRLGLRMGGSDVSACLYWLLTRAYFPYRQCNLSVRLDALLLQDLKETYCHLEQEVQDAEEHTILVRVPNQRVIRYTLRLGDERILAPLSLFFPDMFGLKGSHLCFKTEKFCSDPSDPMDDDYLLQTMSKHEKAARGRKKETVGNTSLDFSATDYGAQGCDDDDMDDADQPSSRMNSQTWTEEDVEVDDLDQDGLVGLQEAICMSIEKCDSDDMKKRMYSCIIVVGGGLMFPGAQSWLQFLLWAQMPAQARLSLESMDVIVRPKELDPRMTCWKGGAIMSCLDTAAELWISQEEWTKYGIRIFRERAPFLW